MEKYNLEEYVVKASPKVNQLLRGNIDASEYTFDSLFEKGIVSQPLYRLIKMSIFTFKMESLLIKDICLVQVSLIHLSIM